MAGAPRAAWILWLFLLWAAPTHAAYVPEVPSAAFGQSPFYDGHAAVSVRLLSDVEQVRAGSSFTAGVLFDLAPDWHIYWADPGDAGLATELLWRSGDAVAGPIQWPKPRAFVEGDGVTTYGYRDRVLLPATVNVSDSVGSHLDLEVTARYLACRVICSPGQVTLRRRLPVGSQASDAEPPLRALFAAAAKQRTAPPVAAASARGAADVEPTAVAAAAAPATTLAVAALPASQAATETAPPTAQGLARVLLLALLGGLILNVMPCVLPVLVIKLFGLLQISGGKRAQVVAHGLAYAAGVVGAMLALAALVLALKAAGEQVGWGFQFQEPRFLIGLCALLVAFALNCFGAFEVLSGAAGLDRAVRARQGLARSAMEGVLAVALATPCSAPFLGSAVAYALTAPAYVTLLVFACVGIGLALPLLLLCLLPDGRRFVPRPGAWMGWVKQAMGFALLLTVVWLLWLLGRSAGVDAQAQVMVALLALAAIAWVYGLALSRMPSRQLPLLVLALLTAGGVFYLGVDLRAARPLAAPVGHGYAPWSHAAVRAALAARRPVFVDFSADWCITCKYNERHVLAQPRVLAAFAEHQVVLLRADWSRRDAAIRSVLQSFGRPGVPMVLLYDPAKPAGPPQLLPEILSEEVVLQALASLAPQPLP